jgi:hypothetical protein
MQRKKCASAPVRQCVEEREDINKAEIHQFFAVPKLDKSDVGNELSRSLSGLLSAEHSLKGACFLLLQGRSEGLGLCLHTAWRLAPHQEISQIVRSGPRIHGIPRLVALLSNFGSSSVSGSI